MANMKTLKERYVEAYEKFDEGNGIKNELTNSMLKDELIEFACECGVEVENRWTKDEIAERLISPEIYENISGSKEEVKEEEPRDREPEKLQPSFRSFPPMPQHDSLLDAWNTLSKGVEDNLKRFTDSSMERWESMEKEWTSRAKEFQQQIDSLGDEGIPAEEYKDISVIWRNFFNKMTARLLKTSTNFRERRDRLTDIVNKYDSEVRETLGKGDIPVEDFGRFYTLWLDMTRDIREEMEKTGNNFAVDYDELSDTWEKFSEKTIRMLNDFKDNRKQQGDELYNSWNRIFKDVNEQIYKGIDDSRNWYQEVWKTVDEQNNIFIGTMTDGFKELEQGYSTLLTNTLDLMRSGFRRTFMGSEDPIGNEMDDIRKRIEKLEEKL